MEVERIADGLWRWTAPHPDWTETEDWPRDVGCVYWEGPDAIVLVDPLVPVEPSERERFHLALDRDVARIGLPVAILRTCRWHGRSIEELAARHDATVHTRADDPSLPADVHGITAAVADEVVWWLEGARTLVVGDVLLGAYDTHAEPLRLCPPGWIEGQPVSTLAAELAPLLALEAERVLVSHGAPVLAGGAAELRRALER